ncbi:MAG: GNAT family N-acetyltransferase [Candidatus Buchananbacteria bacterium CG10_big_fil_rev_8_21_14_0_10_42_9]|uniref:GNAT family N-acetyltransferase n=1 Tax=Candidatus Buchananbacteria bacterium CG10_big_fil_rev_8_21_14_0_10_42_9 TaxID=1974526 RepID=A0A2H0W1R0_9BACT|nr:MAG: GNAT family N-acetyltransferase [Candidatus Buchananbacteria bacterium CG10_big_fil_rev_8_21_14_0_10_42_9]
MAQAKKIVGERVYLRELTLADATQEYCDWLNDPEVNYYLETRQSTISELEKYIQKQIDDPNSFFVGIFDNTNDLHIGNIKLEPIEWDKKVATFGILIGNKDYWNKGIGTEATNLIVRHAFEEMQLDEIKLGVIDLNKRAIRAYEKVGFKMTGVRKNAIDHDGQKFDDVIMTIKKENYV